MASGRGKRDVAISGEGIGSWVRQTGGNALNGCRHIALACEKPIHSVEMRDGKGCSLQNLPRFVGISSIIQSMFPSYW